MITNQPRKENPTWISWHLPDMSGSSKARQNGLDRVSEPVSWQREVHMKVNHGGNLYGYPQPQSGREISYQDE